jgi:hypothetical protein
VSCPEWIASFATLEELAMLVTVTDVPVTVTNGAETARIPERHRQ